MIEVTSRRLDPATDTADLIELFDAVFGHTVTPLMWAWKYRPPYSERHYCWVGACEGKIIGYVGAMPLRGVIDGEDVPFFQMADIMVHPKYRLKVDYFSLGHEAVLADIGQNHPRHLLYGFSDHRAFRWFERLGWSALIEKAVTRFARPRAVADLGEFAFPDWGWDNPGIDAVWARFRPSVRAGLIRDQQYLAWRFGAHPVFPYRLFGVTRGGETVGWIVLGRGGREENGNPKPDAVVDILVPDGTHEETLQALSDHTGKPLMTWLPTRFDHFAEEKETGTHVYHFVSNSAVKTAFLRENFYYTMGDVDWW